MEEIKLRLLNWSLDGDSGECMEYVSDIGGPKGADRAAAKFFAAVARRLDKDVYEAMLEKDPLAAEASVQYRSVMRLEGSKRRWVPGIGPDSPLRTLAADRDDRVECVPLAMACRSGNLPAVQAIAGKARPRQNWLGQLQECAVLALAHEFEAGFECILDKLCELGRAEAPESSAGLAVNGMGELVKRKESRFLDLAARGSLSPRQRLGLLKWAAGGGARSLPEKMARRGVWLSKGERQAMSAEACAGGHNETAKELLGPCLEAAAIAGALDREISEFGLSREAACALVAQRAAALGIAPGRTKERLDNFADLAMALCLGPDEKLAQAGSAAVRSLAGDVREGIGERLANKLGHAGAWEKIKPVLKAIGLTGKSLPAGTFAGCKMDDRAVVALASAGFGLRGAACSAAERKDAGQLRELLAFELDLSEAQIAAVVAVEDPQVAALAAKHVKDAGKLDAKTLARFAVLDPEGSKGLLERARWTPLSFLRLRRFGKDLEAGARTQPDPQPPTGEMGAGSQAAAEDDGLGEATAPSLRRIADVDGPLQEELDRIDRLAAAFPGPVGEKLRAIGKKAGELSKAQDAGAEWAFASHLLRNRIPRLLEAYGRVGESQAMESAEKLGDLTPQEAVLEALGIGERRLDEMLAKAASDSVSKLAWELEVFKSSKF